jgi:hypothetical protein
MVTLFFEKRGGNLPFVKITPTPTVYRVVNKPESDIAKITLISGSREIIAFNDPEMGWKIISPEGSALDKGVFLEKLSEILSLKVYGLLEKDSSDELLGINNPKGMKIIIEYTDGKSDLMNIGNQTPIESGYYARLMNGDAVILNKLSIENIQDLFTQYFPE